MSLITLKIVSWENDGDDYRTEYQHGLTAADAAFITDLANQFSSCNGRNGGMGNEEHDADTLIEMIAEVLGEHPDVSDDVRDYWTFAEGQEQYVYERLYEEILCWPVQYDYKFCRVVESVTATEYLPPAVEGHTMEWVRENHEEAYKALRSAELNQEAYRKLLVKVVENYNHPDVSMHQYMEFLGLLKTLLEGTEAEMLVAMLKAGSEDVKAGRYISGEELMADLSKRTTCSTS